MLTTILAILNSWLSAFGEYASDRQSHGDEAIQILERISGKLDRLAMPPLPCGCTSGTDIDPPSAIENGGDPPDEDYEDYKCKAATMFVRTYIYVLNDWANRDYDTLLGIGITAAAEVLAAVFVLGPVAIAGATISMGALVIFGALVAIVALIFSEAAIDLGDMASILEANELDFICTAYNASSGEEARANFLELAETLGMTSLELQVLGYVVNNYDMNRVMQLDESIAQIDFATMPYDCSGCGGSTCAEALGANLSIVLLENATVEPVNGGNAVYQGDGVWRFSGGANAGAKLVVDLTSCGFNWGADSGSRRFGFEATVLSKSVSAVGFQSASDVFHGQFNGMAVNTTYRNGRTGEDAALASWVAEASNSISWVGHVGRARFYFLQFGGSGAYTADVRLRVVVHNAAAI